MSDNVVKARGFNWTEVRLQAAQLLAEDRISDTDIAAKCKISVRQLIRWKEHPIFQAKVAECVKAIEDAIMRQGIARRVNRIKAVNERWDKMQQVVQERSSHPDMQALPGGKTGLLVIKESEIVHEEIDGKERIRVVPTKVAVDTALLREMREHEKQVAQELGQWTEKQEVAGPGGGPLVVVTLAVSASMDDI